MNATDAVNVGKYLERLAADPDEPAAARETAGRVAKHLLGMVAKLSEPLGDGGPAFPMIRDTRYSPDWDHEPGMTLRDYFIAHAPAEPQSWFTPAMPAEPGPQPAPPELMTEAEQDELEGYRNSGDAERMQSPRVRAYASAMEEFDRSYSAWIAELHKQRYLQWPAAWADEQLRLRKAAP